MMLAGLGVGGHLLSGSIAGCERIHPKTYRTTGMLLVFPSTGPTTQEWQDEMGHQLPDQMIRQLRAQAASNPSPAQTAPATTQSVQVDHGN